MQRVVQQELEPFLHWFERGRGWLPCITKQNHGNGAGIFGLPHGVRAFSLSQKQKNKKRVHHTQDTREAGRSMWPSFLHHPPAREEHAAA